MGTCRTFGCKRSRGKGFESTSNMGPTPATDLAEVDPNAGHQGEFIVAVLEEGYQRDTQGSGNDLRQGVSSQQGPRERRAGRMHHTS